MSNQAEDRVYYSQNREDLILESFFLGVKKGFYVDVGAYHPDVDSVTKRFYDAGWSGINIEPQKNIYEIFKKKRKRDLNLNIGISDKSSTLVLRSYSNQGRSTFSQEIKNSYNNNGNKHNTSSYTDVKVQVKTLKSVLEAAKVSAIQFLKVDVEGYEYEVLAGNDWEKFRPEVICIEGDHIVKDWNNLLLSNSYEFIFFDGLNKYYVDSRTDRASKFDYVNHVVLNLHGGISLRDNNNIKKVRLLNAKYADLVENYQKNLDAVSVELSTVKYKYDELTKKQKSIKKRLLNFAGLLFKKNR